LRDSGVAWMLKYPDIVVQWNGVVGPEFADQTRVVGLRNNSLVVDVASPTVKAELEQFHNERILAALRTLENAQSIQRIRYRLVDRIVSIPEEH